MCGIAGIKRMGDEPITETQIRLLACAIEHRGNQATGVAVMNGEDIAVLKSDVPAWKFVADDLFKKFLKDTLTKTSDAVLIHTRAATKGDPRENENNHPIFAGNTAVIHNGMISNDDWLFKDMKMTRKAEVDSDVLRAILDEHGGLTRDGIKNLSRVRGSAAIAAISKRFPGKLLLARSGSPLVLASTPGQLMWASEKGALHLAIRPFIKRYGILMQPNRADAAFITMNNDSAWIIGEGGMEWHGEFSATQYYNPPTYRVHENYRAVRSRWGYKPSFPADMVICPNKDCRNTMMLGEEFKNYKLEDLECPKCNTSLVAA